MRIAGFGDSFITANDLDYTYTNRVSQHFNAECALYGKEGSGAWDAFFTFLDTKQTYDVVMFAWSAEHRLYHPHHSNICPAVIDQNLGKHPVWEAAKQFYAHLGDSRKSYFEHLALYSMIDNYLRDYHPNTKVIHMWGFPGGNMYTHDGVYIQPPKDPYTWGQPERFNYIYRFNHGVEIRPALINLSYRDGWPTDLSKETRCHHLTPTMHEHLSKYVIDAIENYVPGRLVELS